MEDLFFWSDLWSKNTRTTYIFSHENHGHLNTQNIETYVSTCASVPHCITCFDITTESIINHFQGHYHYIQALYELLRGIDSYDAVDYKRVYRAIKIAADSCPGVEDLEDQRTQVEDMLGNIGQSESFKHVCTLK